SAGDAEEKNNQKRAKLFQKHETPLFTVLPLLCPVFGLESKFASRRI
ncbi:MAG: hypothetical protein UY15_C0014G0001, partial [Parcubacteria group bacterium GW2011_GWA2_47_9]